MDLKALHRQGQSIRALARLTGHSRNTIRTILRSATLRTFKNPERTSKLDDFKQYVATRYLEAQLSAVRLLSEIRAQGYSGSVDLIRRYVRTLKAQVHASRKLTVRFETQPGQQAQADWADCGTHTDQHGRRVRIYAFRMVLGFSRMEFVDFTTSMDMAALIECHLLAFDYFGGVPAEILYDNMKQVISAPGKWNPQFLDFMQHYAIAPRTCRAYRARTKGKVERSIRYLRDNFLRGRSFADLHELRAQARHWLDTVANVRTHATTGRRPIDLLPAENLRSIASHPRYKYCPRQERIVDAESFVHYDGSTYSVPPRHCGQKVSVGVDEQRRVIIRMGETIIAEHPHAEGKGQSVADPRHIQERWKLSVTDSRSTAKAPPPWTLRFEQSVAATPLSRYETVA